MRYRFVRCMLPFLAVTLALTALAVPAENESLGLREVKLEIKDLQLKLTERIIKLERAHTIIFGLLGVTPLALFGLYRQVLRKAGHQMQERLESIIESRPGALLKLIDEYDLNQRLRRTTRVTIVSDNLELEGVLRQHGFKKLTTIKAEGLTGTEVDKNDASVLTAARAVILDLVNGLDEQLATKVMRRHGLEHVLAFSFERVHLPEGETTFANSHMTLFVRLEELLKYQDASEPRPKGTQSDVDGS